MANTIKLKRASGSDPSASDLAVGELAIRTSNCKLFSKNDSGNAIGIVSGSADTLTTARTIAGVSFDGSANISLNNNAITNGAGYITDLVNDSSPQLGGNLDLQSSGLTTSTSNGNIKATPNGSGVFEVRSSGSVDGTLQLNCTVNSHGIKLKSPPHSAGATYTLTFPDDVQNGKFLQTDTNGNLSWASATNITNNNQISNGAGYITATLTNEQVQDIVGGMVTGNTETGITVTYQDGDGTLDFVVGTLNQDTTGNAATATTLETARTIAGVSFDGSANISLNNNAITNGAGYITSADGGNAATLDSIDSSQFLRSDTADSSNSLISLNGGVSITGRASSNVSTVSSGSTITLDMTSSTHFFVDLGTNTTFASPSNQSSAIGQSGSIFIQQDGGSRTASFNSVFKFTGGTAPTLSTADNAVDRIDYVIKANNEIHAVISLDVK